MSKQTVPYDEAKTEQAVTERPAPKDLLDRALEGVELHDGVLYVVMVEPDGQAGVHLEGPSIRISRDGLEFREEGSPGYGTARLRFAYGPGEVREMVASALGSRRTIRVLPISKTVLAEFHTWD